MLAHAVISAAVLSAQYKVPSCWHLPSFRLAVLSARYEVPSCWHLPSFRPAVFSARYEAPACWPMPSFRLAVFSAVLRSHHVGNCWLFCCASRLLCNSFHGSFAMHFVALSPCTVATLPCAVANQQCTMALLPCTLVICCAWAGVTYLI